MFILELTYTAPERADEVMGDHMTWVKKQFEAGVFIASGRKVPRDGGVILAVGESRPDIEALAAADPFVTRDVAAYRITEFLATTTAPALDSYRQQAG